MIKFENFNHISDKAIPKIRDYVVGADNAVYFRLLGINKPDPAVRQQKGIEQLMLPFSVMGHVRSRITDPITNEPVDLVFIKSITFDNKIIFHKPQFKRENGGMIICRVGNPEEEDLFEYLMLSPDRGVLYELVDKVGSSEKEFIDREQVSVALHTAFSMDKEQMKKFALSMGWDHYDDKITKNAVTSFAQNNPEQFLEALNDKSMDIKAVIKKAFDSKIIVVDLSNGKYRFSSDGSVIYHYGASVTADNYVSILNDYLFGTEKGLSLMEVIKSKVDKKEKKDSAKNEK